MLQRLHAVRNVGFRSRREGTAPAGRKLSDAARRSAAQRGAARRQSTKARGEWCMWRALLIFTLVAGCSDDGSGDDPGSGGTAGASGSACSTEADCPSFGCECKNGTTYNKERSCSAERCEDPASMCTTVCANAGGLDSFGAESSVADSAECKAFCERISTECPGAQCKVDVACYVYKRDCAEAVKADLACATREAELTCSANGYSFIHNGNGRRAISAYWQVTVKSGAAAVSPEVK
jgi:hypothetical protein